ncbi:MAG: hypothetical protein H6779_00945 [Candidatus Nomurabacteria bacterium]|nr:hypothetical protein [Candidatus Nomurabacteria bacterium]USN87997.1 MAG: hypothetical protein H6779_00945 [Candidatus Nomurabacteria bacterium]
MEIPVFSIISLITEILVTVSVLVIIYKAYYTGVFMRGFAFFVLGYEIMFNISYMLSRVLHHLPEHHDSHHEPFELGLAIFHGTFSLIMFIGLVIFFLMAAKKYATGENYFAKHPRFTSLFIAAWLVSVFSGMLFFYLLYV